MTQNNIFRFKRFAVSNCRSAMKVNTDGVLLGAAMTLRPSDRRLLDIGTGTGVIALMAAQRLSDIGACFNIDAIDIDGASAEEAEENFGASPWAGHLHAGNISLDRYAAERLSMPDTEGFDLVFSNPPYFESSLKAPEARRRDARHAETMSYREILDFAAAALSADGRLAMILPADIETDLVRHAAARGLHPFRILQVRSTPGHPVSRIIAEFSRNRAEAPQTEELIIQIGGAYSPAYRTLFGEFLFI